MFKNIGGVTTNSKCACVLTFRAYLGPLRRFMSFAREATKAPLEALAYATDNHARRDQCTYEHPTSRHAGLVSGAPTIKRIGSAPEKERIHGLQWVSKPSPEVTTSWGQVRAH